MFLKKRIVAKHFIFRMMQIWFTSDNILQQKIQFKLDFSVNIAHHAPWREAERYRGIHYHPGN